MEYAPMHFLRQAENALLREYFTARGLLRDLDWEALGETEVEPIWEAWRGLSPERHDEVEQDFRDVFDLSSDNGIRALAEEGQFHGVDLLPMLASRDGYSNKALAVLLTHQSIFNVAHTLNWADGLNRRYWRKRKGIPKKAPDCSSAARSELEAAISSYFSQHQGRGKNCHVDMYLRGHRLHYFFAYPQDYTDTFIGFDKEGRFRRRRVNPAFEVVFVLDPEEGALDLYVQGDKGIVRDLQKLFGRTILDVELGEEAPGSVAYELNILKRRPMLPTDPIHRIRDVRVSELRLAVIGSGRRRITLEAGDPTGSRDAVYELMETALDARHLPLSMVNVNSAVIKITFENGDGASPKRKTLTFRISFPNSCNLKDSPADLVAKKYLREWGIERS